MAGMVYKWKDGASRSQLSVERFLFSRPRDISTRVISTNDRNLVTRVQELIDPMTNVWDGQEIIKIPVHDQFDDQPAWHYDKRGLFPVKSAYKVARDSSKAHESIQGLATTSNSATDNQVF